MKARVLLFGRNERLLKLRKAILALNGLFAVSTTELTMVPLIAVVEPVRVLVLCHTLSRKEQEAALASVRRHRPAAVSVHLLSETSPPVRAKSAAVLFAPGAPHSLAIAVRNLLSPGVERLKGVGAGMPENPGLLRRC
jgi:hypothetical protein